MSKLVSDIQKLHIKQTLAIVNFSIVQIHIININLYLDVINIILLYLLFILRLVPTCLIIHYNMKPFQCIIWIINLFCILLATT